MEFATPQTIEIRHETALDEARRAARSTAESVGFDSAACEDVALVTSELASNLARHAGGGQLVLTALTDGQRRGLQVESLDSGPGIANVEQAMADGFSTGGSLGFGLGVANRLMDELDIQSHRGGGTHVVCRKWVRKPVASTRQCPLATGAATRPHLSFTENGDAFVIRHWDESLLVGVIDGLGHGPYAYRAARTAWQYVETHFDSALENIFLGVGRACRATRGVVMALARFDWGRGRVTFASVGNIEARSLHGSAPSHYLVRRGIIGVSAPKPMVEEYPWAPEDVMVMHSDGVPSHWKWDELPGLAEKPAGAIAQDLLRDLGKPDDDATVVVVRSAVR